MPKIAVTKINDNLVHVRGGEVVLYKRGDSAKWQARYKLKDLKWHRVATKHANIQYAAEIACEAYDRARFLFDEKVPITSKRFDDVASKTAIELERMVASGVGKSVYNDYVRVINQYLIPFFGKKFINTIGYEDVSDFNEWRIKKMGKVPVQSTVVTQTSAFNRVFDFAVERGWILQSQVPKMKASGEKGKAREAFSLSEYKSLTTKMATWCKKGHTAKTKEMRELLRDYVLILANTGIRHGTEARSIMWKDIEWIKKDDERYLHITVTGKVGKRTLIANHNTEIYLTRLAQRQPELAKLTFDNLLKKKLNEPIFKLKNGETTTNLNGTFRTLMRDSGLDKNKQTFEKRTLYSLRHTYAHLALLKDKMDVYTLAKQMGTSVKMIEMHYGHLKPAMKADVIAGKRKGINKEVTEETKVNNAK